MTSTVSILEVCDWLQADLEQALLELDNTTAAEGSEDSLGCAENALHRALATLTHLILIAESSNEQ